MVATTTDVPESGAALRERAKTAQLLVDVALYHRIGWPESLTMHEYPPEPDSEHDYRRAGYGILGLSCATETDLRDWCKWFDVEPAHNEYGWFASAEWLGWRVQIHWYDGGAV